VSVGVVGGRRVRARAQSMPTHRFAMAGLLCIALRAHGYMPRMQATPHQLRCASPISCSSSLSGRTEMETEPTMALPAFIVSYGRS